MDFNFLIKNIFFPERKRRISLGNSEQAIRYLKYFNSRSVKRLFIRTKKYNCAVIHCDSFASGADYILSVKGKNSADYFSRKCRKHGYSVKEFNPNEFLNEIFEINNSSKIRQGREMDASYRLKVEAWPNDNSNKWIGVFSIDNKLVGYLWLVLENELALINRVLGHFDHLKHNIMYLLTIEAIIIEIDLKQRKIIMYDTFGAKKNGLVLFKKRMGFKANTITFIS